MNAIGWLRMLGTTGLILVLFNALVAWRVRSQGEELLRQIPHAHAYDCLFVGNSTMDADLDIVCYAQASAVSSDHFLKLAIGGGTAEEESLVLNEFFTRGNTAKRVVLGFHDLHLEGNAKHTWSTLTGAFGLIYSTSQTHGLRVYALPATERAKVALTRCVPALARRANLWGKVELLRRALTALGMPTVQTTAYGRVADFKFYPYLEKDREEAHAVMQQFIQSHAALSRPLQLIVNDCKDHNAELIVLEMPLLKERTDLCVGDPRWQAYRDFRQDSLEESGAHYMRGFESLGGAENFKDPVHMTPHGAELFSRRLAEVMTQAPLPSSL